MDKYFTDQEYRLLLAALRRERKVCEMVDKDCGEEHKLLIYMDSIEKKIKRIQYEGNLRFREVKYMHEVFETILDKLSEVYINNKYNLYDCHANVGIDQAEQIIWKVANEYDNGWIPTSERLPNDPIKLVLVQVSGKPKENITLDNALELATYKAECGWILEEYPEWEDASIIAWQPLPELYKPDEEKEG